MNEPAHLSRLLQTGLRQRPDQTAIIFEGRTYTYDVLERRVSALASRFAASGLARERVGLMLPSSIELVCCYLACFRIGAVAAPISDHYAAPELARALGCLKARRRSPRPLHQGASCVHRRSFQEQEIGQSAVAFARHRAVSHSRG